MRTITTLAAAIVMTLTATTASAAIVTLEDGYKAINHGNGIVEIQQKVDGKWTTHTIAALDEQTSFRGSSDMTTVMAATEETKKQLAEWKQSQLDGSFDQGNGGINGEIPETDRPTVDKPNSGNQTPDFTNPSEGVVERPRPDHGIDDDFAQPEAGSGIMNDLQTGVELVNDKLDHIATSHGSAIQNNYAAIQQNTAAISNLNGRVDSIEKDLEVVQQGVAMSMAMSSIPQAMYKESTTVGAGFGNFAGQSAVAVGVSHRFDSVTVNVNVSATADNTGAGIGIGYSF